MLSLCSSSACKLDSRFANGLRSTAIAMQGPWRTRVVCMIRVGLPVRRRMTKRGSSMLTIRTTGRATAIDAAEIPGAHCRRESAVVMGLASLAAAQVSGGSAGPRVVGDIDREQPGSRIRRQMKKGIVANQIGWTGALGFPLHFLDGISGSALLASVTYSSTLVAWRGAPCLRTGVAAPSTLSQARRGPSPQDHRGSTKPSA